SKTLPDGFVIDGADRPEVTVNLLPYGFTVSYDGDVSTEHGLVEFGKLTESIAQGLMRNWTRPADKAPREECFNVKNWAIRQTTKTISKRVHEQWRELITRVDPQVLAVQRACYSVSLGCPDLAADSALYQDKFLVGDICKYRAAAIACVMPCHLCEGAAERRA